LKYLIRGSQKSACVSKENGKRKREMVNKKICAKGKEKRKEKKTKENQQNSSNDN
jgi:hypothetical protein